MAGSYALTGAAAALTRQLILNAGAGAYDVTGTDAGLVFGFNLAAESGAYAVSGSAASLKLTKLLEAIAGSYIVVGGDSRFTRTPPPEYTGSRSPRYLGGSGSTSGSKWKGIP